MLQALVQESHLDLKSMGTPGFDWGIAHSVIVKIAMPCLIVKRSKHKCRV